MTVRVPTGTGFGRPHRKWKRWLRWIGLACLVPILLVLVALLSAPFWVNDDLVKREVTRIISSATGGKAQFERIELHFFPLPAVVVSRLRFSLPDMLEVQAQSASVDIRFLPLLLGNVYPHRVRVTSPQIRVQLEEPKPSPQPQPQAKPFSLKDTEAGVRSVLEQIEAALPGLAAEVEAGRLELRIGKRPPLLVEHLEVHADVTASAVAAKVSFNSNLLEQFTAEVRLTSKDLSGDGHVELSGVQVAHLGPILGMQDGWPVQEAVVNAKLELRMRGLSDAQAEVSIDAPKVALQFGKGRLELVGPAIEVAAQTKGESAEVTLRRVAVDSPRVALSAKFVKSETGGYALESDTNDVDLLALQAVGQGLAPAVDWLVNFPVTIARGTLTAVKFSTQAATLEDLFDLQALRVSATVNNVDLSLPVFHDLKVTQVNAVASLEQGVVRVQQARARLDKTIARDGSFDMNLNLDALPLHVDITAAVDLPEAFALAKRVLPDPQSQQQFDQIKQLEGSAVAHVMVGGNVSNVAARVEVSGLNVSARHDLVPFPIRVTGGTLTYTDTALSVRGLDGAIGLSSFTGVSARLGLNPPYPLSAQQGSALLALEQLFDWAAAQPQFAKQLEGVEKVSGHLALSVVQLEVPLNKPELLRFQVAATPKDIVADAPRYGPRAQLDGGVIEVSQQSVSVKRVRAEALDAVLGISGGIEDYRQGIGELKASATGTVGLEALKWVYARAGLPQELRLRGPLTVSEANVDWRKGAGVAANGSVNVIGGPAIGFAVRSIPKRLEVEKFTLRDEASNVSFGGSLEGTHYTATYKGRLAGSSIEHIFADAPVTLDELQGDFHADGDLNRPDATTATGYLKGAEIRLPPALPMPVTIEKLSLEAKDTVLTVKSATVSSGESRLELSGTVTHLHDKFAVDADIRGDMVVVPVPATQPEAAPKSEAAPDQKPAPEGAPKPETNAASTAPGTGLERAMHQVWEIPVSGLVRVDIGLIRAGTLEISPLVGSASLETGHLELSLQRAALCAIALSGGLTAQPGNVELNVKLSARGAQLDKSIACLTSQRLQITGEVDVDAAFSAQGKPGTLLDQMQGTFSAAAKNGRINQFESLSQILKLVNVTQVVAGQMPDLSKGGMAYHSAQVDGRVEGRKISFHQAALDASGVKIAAHGNVNYGTGAIDVDVLVAPLQTANWVLSYIPILRKMLGGMILAVPVHVGGTMTRPIVVPLGARAVGSRLVDIMDNTLKLPADLINYSSPAAAGTGASPNPAKQ